jgi:hypothetical protein
MTGHAGIRPESAPSQRTPERPRGRFNVYAAFEDQAQAQHALEALGRNGFDGARTSLRGPDDAMTAQETAETDRRVLMRWFGTVSTWAAVGALIGFVAGIPVGAFALDAIGEDVTFTALLVAALLGALFLSTIAGLTATVWPVQAGDAWEQTFHATHGERIVVGVHVDDREAAENALGLLNADGPVDTFVSGATDEGRHEAAV